MDMPITKITTTTTRTQSDSAITNSFTSAHGSGSPSPMASPRRREVSVSPVASSTTMSNRNSNHSRDGTAALLLLSSAATSSSQIQTNMKNRSSSASAAASSSRAYQSLFSLKSDVTTAVPTMGHSSRGLSPPAESGSSQRTPSQFRNTLLTPSPLSGSSPKTVAALLRELNDTKDVLSRESAQFSQDVAERDRQVKDALERCNRAERERDDLSREVTMLRQQQAGADRAWRETVSGKDETIARLQRENVTLTIRCQDTGDGNNSNNNAQTSTSMATLHRLQQQYEERLMSVRMERDAAYEVQGQLEEVVAQHEATIEGLQERVSGITEDWQREVAKCAEVVAEAAAGCGHETRALQESVEALEHKNQMLRETVTARDVHVAELETRLQTALSGHQANQTAVREELRLLREQHQDAALELTELRAERDRLYDRVTRRGEEIANLRRALEAQEDANAQQHVHSASKGVQCRALDDEHLMSQSEAVETRRREVLAELSRKQEDIQKAIAKQKLAMSSSLGAAVPLLVHLAVDSLQDEEWARRRHIEAQAEFGQQRGLHALELQFLRSRCDQMEGEHTALRAGHTTVSEMCTSQMAAQIAQLEGRVSDLEGHNEDLAGRVKLLKRERDALQEQIRDFSKEVSLGAGDRTPTLDDAIDVVHSLVISSGPHTKSSAANKVIRRLRHILTILGYKTSDTTSSSQHFKTSNTSTTTSVMTTLENHHITLPMLSATAHPNSSLHAPSSDTTATSPRHISPTRAPRSPAALTDNAIATFDGPSQATHLSDLVSNASAASASTVSARALERILSELRYKESLVHSLKLELTAARSHHHQAREEHPPRATPIVTPQLSPIRARPGDPH
eukprot:PhM_4_TR3102/c0_g1_i1/m.61427